jgi:transposase-like protein
MGKNNMDVRTEAMRQGVYLWQIAEKLKISEPTLMRWLRNELPADKKKLLLKVIGEIKDGDGHGR